MAISNIATSREAVLAEITTSEIAGGGGERKGAESDAAKLAPRARKEDCELEASMRDTERDDVKGREESPAAIKLGV